VRNRFRAGDHNVISDSSGQKIKRSQARFTWDGFLVDKRDWEPKHPQLTIRARSEKISVEDARTQGEDPALLNPPFEAGDGI
jgi:hypothetical protein